MKRATRIVLFLSTFALLAGATAVAIRLAHRSKPRTWDFSASHNISLVPWPANSEDEMFAAFDVNGRVIVRFPGGKVFDEQVRVIDFHRRGQKIAEVTFMLQDQTPDDAYATASRIARYWEINPQPLKVWHDKVASGAPLYGAGPPLIAETRRNDRPPALSLEVRHSWNMSKPFRIIFQVAITN